MSHGLGLEYGIVRLAPHSAEWAEAFRRERERLEIALAAFSPEIEHVGSTAVPGLAAKPILDIAVGVPARVDLDLLIPVFEGLGCIYRGDAGARGGRLFVRESASKVRTHHLHLLHLDDPQWGQYVGFRDLLIRSEWARQLYLEEKRALAARHPDDRNAYSVAKDSIVQRLLREPEPNGGAELGRCP